MQFDILSMMSSVDKTPVFGTGYLMVIFAVCLVVLIIGSITDFRKREVLDYLSYFLIFSALGIRCIYSVFASDYHILLSGVAGFLLFFIMSVLLYYTGQWGGGDSKVLMGLGAAIGLYIPRDIPFFSQEMLTDFIHHGILRYVLFVILFGALYTVVWSIVLAVVHRKDVSVEFRKNFCFFGPLHIIQDFFSGSLRKYAPEERDDIIIGDKEVQDKISERQVRQRYNKMSYARLFFYLIAFVLGIIFIFSDGFSRNIILFVLITFTLLYLLVIALKSIESVSMMLTVGIDKISEGEWISHDYFIRKRRQESLSEFLERKIRENVLLTIPFTLKGKKDYDVVVADEVRDQYSSTVKEVEKLLFTYSSSRLFSMVRSVQFSLFKSSSAYGKYSENVLSILGAKDAEEFEKTSSRIRKYNKEFNREVLFHLFNFKYDLEYVGGPSQLGIDLEGIELLKKNGVRLVQIRQGIPFVPSFLLAFIFFLIL